MFSFPAMSTVQQSCPQCSSVLELPAESTGRLAKCPACQATFRIGETSQDSEKAAGPTSVQPDSKDATGTADSSHSQADDPHRMPIVKKTIEQVLPIGWSIFLVNWKPSVASCAIAAVAFGVLVVLPVWFFSSLAGTLAVLGMMIMVPITLAVVAYLLVGMCRVHLAIARHEPTPLKQLTPPLPVFLRFLPGYGLLIALGACVTGIALAVVFAMAYSGNMQGANMVGVLLVFVTTILATIAQWYLWSWLMVASDGKTTPMGSLAVSVEVTNQNKLMSFFLVIIAVVLSLAGSLLCYVGHVVTTPLTLVLFAVGYLLCTNQPVADPSEYTGDDYIGRQPKGANTPVQAEVIDGDHADSDTENDTENNGA